MITTPPQTPSPRLLYRLCHVDDWHEAVAAGVFSGTADDARDGYIHLSTADQVEETARLHYTRVRPLMLLEVDRTRLDGEVKWEPSRGGAAFPHLYGRIPLEAVLAALPLREDREGHLIFPPLSDMPGEFGP